MMVLSDRLGSYATSAARRMMAFTASSIHLTSLLLKFAPVPSAFLAPDPPFFAACAWRIPIMSTNPPYFIDL